MQRRAAPSAAPRHEHETCSSPRMASKKPAPWKRPAPKRKQTTQLTEPQKRVAKQHATKAGRPYPNLVDNMNVAKTAKRKTAPRKAAKRKSANRKTAQSKTRALARRSKSPLRAGRRATKDPRGGLTAAGRDAFRRKQGAQLRPGVRKRDSQMTPEEMRRKGSWAVRFYGRKQLPPLLDADGGATRFALSAHAWGEPVPKTIAAARKIAAKGRRVLDKYHRLTS
jgi:hypothetical protein